MFLKKTKNIASIDVWVRDVIMVTHTRRSHANSQLVIKPSGEMAFRPPILTMTVNLWNRNQGDPKKVQESPEVFREVFPKGTFIFPFEFPALPKFVDVTHPDMDQLKVYHPPRLAIAIVLMSVSRTGVKSPSHVRVSDFSTREPAIKLQAASYSYADISGFKGQINFTVGVNVHRDGMMGLDDDFDQTFQYVPLARPLPRVKTPFPFLSTREDWPLEREVVGGWTLSPFGGRGRLGGEEMVEVEGIVREMIA